jgi:Uma2 family endonuclease
MATDSMSDLDAGVLPLELRPSVDHLVTEDDTPVDNIFSEKQQRLLVEPLYSSWAGSGERRSFVAMSNVGLFYQTETPALVPDALLSMGVTVPANIHVKNHRSYFVWEYGKPPDVVIEVVSNREGGEDPTRLNAYARIPVGYYVIFDPERHLGSELLRAYHHDWPKYKKMEGPIWFPHIGLGLSLWQGRYKDMDEVWLRWVNADGVPIATGQERAEFQTQRAEVAEQRAAAEAQRAAAAEQRADRLAQQMRQLGIEPPNA